MRGDGEATINNFVCYFSKPCSLRVGCYAYAIQAIPDHNGSVTKDDDAESREQYAFKHRFGSMQGHHFIVVGAEAAEFQVVCFNPGKPGKTSLKDVARMLVDDYNNDLTETEREFITDNSGTAEELSEHEELLQKNIEELHLYQRNELPDGLIDHLENYAHITGNTTITAKEMLLMSPDHLISILNGHKYVAEAEATEHISKNVEDVFCVDWDKVTAEVFRILNTPSEEARII